MGFDPRDSGRQPSRGVVTSNVDTLLAENDALRREVRRLRQRLQDLHRPGEQRSRPPAPEPVRYGITATQVERWGLAMARHPRWQELRVGPPGGLRGLVEERRRRSWNPQLSLEEDLERRCPGLGVELAQALRGPHSRVRWAVRAAFALYGPSALEWLADEPLRVVEGLLGPGQQRERRPPEGRQQRRRGTRTGNFSDSGEAAEPKAAPTDPRERALALLGLEPDASLAAIKRAYRRLAKQHHPDLGGDVGLFHRLDAAYRLLIG
ncbi:MAG: J domain-containing protein [Cyanobacteriota bacterium]